MIVLLGKQAEGFLGVELSTAGEILDPKAIQHFSSLQLARAAAQRAFNSFGWRQNDGGFTGQYVLHE
jgi:hypothetical protein